MDDNRIKLYHEFLTLFPLESLKDMPIEKYTSNDNDSFCYWVEFKLYELGMIQGSTAYKFGIFSRKAKSTITNIKYTTDGTYAWLTSLGAQRDEVYSKVRERVYEVATLAKEHRWTEIDAVELSHMFKWKIAFLYSDMALIPIHDKDMIRKAAIIAGFDEARVAKTSEYQKYLVEKCGAKSTLDYADQLYPMINAESHPDEIVTDDHSPRYWTYSPGVKASMWEEFYKEGIMGLGWSKIGDISQYKDSAEVSKKIEEIYGGGGSHKNDTCALIDFNRKMKVGDIIIAKRGTTQIVGKGIVESDYYYDPNNEHYPHLRKVNWLCKGEWDAPKMAMKTLTDITNYDGFADKIDQCITVEPVVEEPTESQYWFLNANPKIWSMNDWVVGEEQDYTLFNENGNKRRIFQNFISANDGDKIICYESSPTKQIVGLAEVSKAADGEKIYFRKTESLISPIDYSTLRETPELEGMEYFVNPNGSLFKLTDAEHGTIMDLIRESNPIQEVTANEKYTERDFLSEVFMSKERFDTLKHLLERKQNIILQGAPGVGKTFCAKRLAYAVMGEKDSSRIEFVQFHQNYSYEDFIMGYKPSGESFELRKGIFYNFCKKAQNNPGKPYFFIIDEINRGNMSKIFGELLMLIEKGYRKESATLAYSGERFCVPENLYVIGMMNTADRSLAMIDYALRRRFSFFDMEPCFSDGFKTYQDTLANDRFNRLIELVKSLNEAIRKDDSLGKGFEIGHSYFCNIQKDECTDDLLKEIVNYDLIPTLQEYWFDNEPNITKWSNTLNSIF